MNDQNNKMALEECTVETITPEMIQAGVWVMDGYDPDYISVYELVREVFVSMQEISIAQGAKDAQFANINKRLTNYDDVLRNALVIMESIHKWSVTGGMQVLPGNTESTLGGVIADVKIVLKNKGARR